MSQKNAFCAITFLYCDTYIVIGFYVKVCLIKRWICSDRVYLESEGSWKKLHRDGCLQLPIALIQTASQDGENWKLGNLDSATFFMTIITMGLSFHICKTRRINSGWFQVWVCGLGCIRMTRDWLNCRFLALLQDLTNKTFGRGVRTWESKFLIAP